ncbi:amiloride-sensitive Na+ channel [Culex quinquefasciatus]|uniref:Amiloride-sensitive Na+ channel n=1 Tax=Culex quinquefasciatus TaxID=7176 RepID=B0WDC3_CULQU|nr:amiloride-sensitive Na+ channel [Culex quinquefasciatus]|eukprot:XP_001846707.1 amiloride-sensitive Na+ channel [Culex quinquefasciatus]
MYQSDHIREFPLLYRNFTPAQKPAVIPVILQSKEVQPVSKWSKIRSGLQDLFMEFCRHSTIHGISHIGSRQRSLFEKFWWAFVFLLSMYGCAKLIDDMYRKWDENPVLVAFDEKATPVWNIPFPAITICPETKIQKNHVNFTDLFMRYAHGDRQGLDRTELNILLASLQLCNEWFFVRPEYDRIYEYFNLSESIVKTLQRISLRLDDIIYHCRLHNVPCKPLFSETITEEGICMTFNGLSSEEMFHKDHLHSDYEYLSETKVSENWTLERGYSSAANLSSYPYRVLGSGYQAGIKVHLMTTKNDLEYHCRESQGFKVLLHAPSDYPQVASKFIRVTLNRDIAVAVKPQIISTEAALYDYEPVRRQCYFNRERQLKFFRVYSQPNCQLECLTNFTLLLCGCVPYWMPRSSQTRFCETYEIRCALGAQQKLMLLNARNQIQHQSDKRIKCDCLPACNSIQYDAEITQTMFNFKETIKLRLGPINITYQDIVDNKLLSKLEVYFKDVQFITSKRTEMYGLTDFVASCGGILGLCMGVSLLSLVELLYFSTIRPFMLVKRTVQRQQKVVQVVGQGKKFCYG